MIQLPDDLSLLDFDGINLMGPTDDGMCELRAMGAGSGMSFGTPKPLTATIQSFLADGAMVTTTGHGNREDLVLVVQVTGEDATATASGAELLASKCAETWGDTPRVLALTWTPPAVGEPCVFDVVSAQIEAFDWDDFAELDPLGLGAYYKMTLTTLPWVRSAHQVTATTEIPPDEGGGGVIDPTWTEIDDCSAASTWHKDSSPAPANNTPILGTDGSGDTYVAGSIAKGGSSTVVLVDKKFTTPPTVTDPYVVLKAGKFWGATDASMVPATAGTFDFMLNDVSVSPVLIDGDHYYFATPTSGTLTRVRVRVTCPTSSIPYARLMVRCNDVSSVDMLGPSGGGSISTKEQTLQWMIRGTVRTPASLEIGTDGEHQLGTVLIYTAARSNAVTALMPGCQSSTTVDGTAYSNESIAITSAVNFDVPLPQPAGYELWARVKAPATGSNPVAVTVSTWVYGTQVGPSSTVTLPCTIAAANTWQVVSLGVLPLPGVVADNPDAVLRVTLDATATMTLDDAWIMDLDAGQVTVVDCGANIGLWVDAANSATPFPRIWVAGTAGIDARYVVEPAKVLAAGGNQFKPPNTWIFIASENPVYTSLTYYPLWVFRSQWAPLDEWA